MPVVKEECCGHIQKRMGKALMNVVNSAKGTKFVVNSSGYVVYKDKPDTRQGDKLVRGIGGIGKLTAKAIKSIQGHYGGAIRNNVGDLDGMKKSIWAIYHHRSGNHEHCGDWCSPDPIIANKNWLPPYICEQMRPAFGKLSADALLEKCLHGGTQNANESYHNNIWTLCPK